MMLRASSDVNDLDIDLSLVRGGHDEDSPIPQADELVAFVEAAVEGGDAFPAARDALIVATDEATMVDAAAVIANFEMMTRIADGTGTAHPQQRLEGIADLREELELDSFQSARL